MALVDFAPVQSGSSIVIPAVRRWFAARRAAREQHLALQSLLFMPQHRLNDLGISQDQLARAMEIHRK